MVSIDSILAEHGPCTTSKLAYLLTQKTGMTEEAARKRVSRGSEHSAKLGYITFPRNVRFIYLKKHYTTALYWERLLEALKSTNSIYGLALNSLKQSGSISSEKHFLISCGAPFGRLKKHLSADTVLERLEKSSLVERRDVAGIGPCVMLKGQGSAEMLESRLRARLVAERILLGAISSWIQKLGIGSYHSTKTREDESTYPPMVSSYAWDLTAPSYLYPMVERYSKDTYSPGFVMCDVSLSSEVTEDGLRPFINKCDGVRGLKNLGRCLQIFVADRYTSSAFTLAKRKGVIPATPETLFGKEVAEGLRSLIDTLEHAATNHFSPEKFEKLFKSLESIEGATMNLRGSLFEYLCAEIIRQRLPHALIKVGRDIRTGVGGETDVDVLAETANGEIYFAECKGYKPYREIPHETVKKWLQTTVPTIREFALRNPSWDNRNMVYELWTTGKLSEESVKFLEHAKRTISSNKYTIEYYGATETRKAAEATGDKKLLKVLENHYLKSSI